MSADAPQIEQPEADPYRKESLDFWRQMGKEMLRGSPGRIDEAGKVVVTVAGVLSGLYLNAIAFGDLQKLRLTPGTTLWFLLPIALLALGLLCALVVFFPDKTEWDFRSAAGAQAFYRKTIPVKWWALWLALVCITLAVIAIGVAVYIYLTALPVLPAAP